ncbi:MAG TPA: sulfate adenylyltransferase, partial [Thermoplasmata archaeon]|nr:sulfate adenylyltransferase [Thermoplasmata archaeon]
SGLPGGLLFMVIAQPHGGRLVRRIASGETAADFAAQFGDLPQIAVSDAIAQDVENLAGGGFSPLDGFLDRAALDSVLREMRLPSGTVWSIPLLLPVAAGPGAEEGEEVILRGSSGTRALLEISEVYDFDRDVIASRTFGTLDPTHPGVEMLKASPGRFAAGRVTLLKAAPPKFDGFSLGPEQTREVIGKLGWKTVAGFQTRNVPHLAHEHVQKTALNLVDGLLIQPLVGWKKPGDFTDEAILAAYGALVESYFPAERVLLSVLQTSMRYAGPREAIFHAIVRKNFGCTHFIVGRDHAGVGKFYGPYDAQKIFERFDPKEIGVEILRLSEAFVCRKCGGPQTDRTCPHKADDRLSISGTKFRALLTDGKNSDSSLVRPEVLAALQRQPRLFVE